MQENQQVLFRISENDASISDEIMLKSATIEKTRKRKIDENCVG